MRRPQSIRRTGAIACAAAAAIALYLILRGSAGIERLGKELGGLRDELGSLSAYAAESRGLEASALDRLGKSLEAEYAASRAYSDRSLAALSSRISTLSERIAAVSRGIGEGRSGGGDRSFDAAMDSRIRRADEAYRAGGYSEAAADYAALLALAPEEELFLERRAVSLYRSNPADSGNYGSIERDLKALISRGSGGPEALEVLALISIERGEWSQAIEGYAVLLRARPDDLDLVVAACDCALLAGDEESAERFLRLARLPERAGQRERLELSRIEARLSGSAEASR